LAHSFVIKGDHIQLDQLLKVLGLVGTGGEAHVRIEAGEVLVDGVVEERKRAKLRAGQQVQLGDDTVHLVAEQP